MISRTRLKGIFASSCASFAAPNEKHQVLLAWDLTI